MVFYGLERCDLMDAPELDNMNDLMNSCSKVTSRLIESVIQTNQLASQTTPEMQQLFQQWLALLTGELLSHIDTDTTLDVEKLAGKIGVSASTIVSLLLFLHRKGDVTISNVTLEKGEGRNREICHCLTE